MTPTRHIKALLDEQEPPPPNQSLVPATVGKFTFTANGLAEVTSDPGFEDWEAAMGVAAVMNAGLAFLCGDLIRYGEERFGEMAAQVIDQRSWKAETVRAYVWLSSKVAYADRMIDRGLSLAHHLAVAALPAKQQRKWLMRALNSAGEPWTVAELKAAIKNGGEEDEVAWFVLVRANSREDQERVMREAEREGRTCKAVTKKGLKEAGR